MNDRKRILWSSLVLTLLIFAFALIVNHGLDYFRISTIEEVMRTYELDSDSYHTERLFMESFGGEPCHLLAGRIRALKEEIRQVGEELGSYSRFSFFRKKDYDYLKRKYFLLELRFLALVQKVNLQCGQPYLPILFFYEIDNKESERQGFILQDLSKDYEDKVIILSLDKDYKDEPLVQNLVKQYNVNRAPTIIIEGERFEGLTYSGQLNATFRDFIRKADPFAYRVNFQYTPRAAGINITRLTEQLTTITANESISPSARGDAQLVIGRVNKNNTAICASLEHYDRMKPRGQEEQALLYETYASIGCGRNRNAFLRAAATSWREINNSMRAELLEKLAQGRLQLTFDKHALHSNTTVISGYQTPILPQLTPQQSQTVTIGNTHIVLNPGDLVVTQVDRVHRDWLSGQLRQPVYGDELLVTFSERLTYDAAELRSDIGWHEGGRIRDLVQAGVNYNVATGTLVGRNGKRWFAIDNNGTFRFEVPLDKLLYPTTRFLRDDLAVIHDTHGVNMLVEQAIRKNANAVLSDCDHPGKVYAAKYLHEQGIPVICYPDKYVYLALGHNISLVGSPPLSTNGTITFGGRNVTISVNDTVLAVNATDMPYALWYYQTPTSYISTLLEAIPLDVHYHSLTDYDRMAYAIEHARRIDATVLATRVFTRSDYEAVRSWLLEDETRKAIVFHTASYPYGQLLLREFDRVTFDDPNPVFT